MILYLDSSDLKPECKEAVTRRDSKAVIPTFEMLNEKVQKVVKIVGVCHYTYLSSSFGPNIYPPGK